MNEIARNKVAKNTRSRGSDLRNAGVVASLITALWVVFCWAVPATAQVDWDAKISIDLKRASLRETLASFAQIGGGDLVIEPSVGGQVTLRTDGATTFEILDQICKHHHLQCYWGGRPERLTVRESQGFEGLATSISLSLRQAELQQTVEVMSTITDGRVKIQGELAGKVSVEILSAPWPVALTHICEDAGCQVDWTRRPYLVSASPSGAKTGSPSGAKTQGGRSSAVAQPGDLEARVDRLVESAPTAAWGPLRLEVEGTASVDSPSVREAGSTEGQSAAGDATTWGESLSRLCDLWSCRWQLRYDRPSTLLLTWLDPRVDRRVKLSTEARWDQPRSWSAADLASRLAREIGADVTLADGVELAGELKIRQPELSWVELADSLCGALHCRWRVDGARLLLSPSEAPLSLMPTVSAQALAVELRVRGTDHEILHDEVVLDWQNSVYRRSLVSRSKIEGQSAISGRLVVVWLPFSSEAQWVVPIWLPCGGGMPEVSPPVSVSSARADVNVELGFVLRGKGEDAKPGFELLDQGSLDGCLGAESSSGARLSVSLAERQAGRWVRESRFTLDGLPGSYLMVAPPGAVGGSSVAVIFLGEDFSGRTLAALVKPTLASEDSAQPTVELLELDRIDSRPLAHSDRSYRLSLIPSTAPAPAPATTPSHDPED